jgi:hypothetical protein
MKISSLNLQVGDGVEVWPISYVALDSGEKKYQATVSEIWHEGVNGAIFLRLYDGKHLHVTSSDIHGWRIRKLTDVETAVMLVHRS